MSDLPNKEVLLPPLPTEQEDVLTSPASPLVSKQLQFSALHSQVNGNGYTHHSAETSTTTASATSASLSPPHRLLTPSTDVATLEMDLLYFDKISHHYTTMSTVTSNATRPEAGRESVLSVATAEPGSTDFEGELPLASAPDFQLDSPRLTFPPAFELALNLNGSTSPFAASLTGNDEIISTATSTATPTTSAVNRYLETATSTRSASATGTATPANGFVGSVSSRAHSHTNSVSSTTNTTASTISELNNLTTSLSSVLNVNSNNNNQAGGQSSNNHSPLKRLKSFTSRGIRKLSLLSLNLNQNQVSNLNSSSNTFVSGVSSANTPSFISGIPPTMPLQPPMTSTPSALTGNTGIGLPAPPVGNGADGYFANSSSNTPTSNSSYSNLSNYFNRKRSNTTSSSASSHSLCVKFTLSLSFAVNQPSGGALTALSSGTATVASPLPGSGSSSNSNNIASSNGVSGSTLIQVPTVESVETKFMSSNPGFSYDSQLDCLNYLNHLTIERKAMVDSVANLKQQLSKSGWLTTKDLNGMNLSDLGGIDDKINELEELITKKRSSSTSSSNGNENTKKRADY